MTETRQKQGQYPHAYSLCSSYVCFCSHSHVSTSALLKVLYFFILVNDIIDDTHI